MGAGEGGGKCVWRRLCTSAVSNPAHPSLKDGDFGAVTLESEALGEFQRQDLRG